MKSHTSLVAQQTRLSEWADLIRDSLARKDEVKCLHSLLIIMGYFLGQHNPSNYFALTFQAYSRQQAPGFPAMSRIHSRWQVLFPDVSVFALPVEVLCRVVPYRRDGYRMQLFFRQRARNCLLQFPAEVLQVPVQNYSFTLNSTKYGKNHLNAYVLSMLS